MAEWVVYDELSQCPYLEGETARFPLRLPARPLSGMQLSQRLHSGDRRQGMLLYRPTCPTCRACQALRIDVHDFRPSKTQRRVFRRGEEVLETSVGLPEVTHEKVALYNRHKIERNLLIGDGLIDPDSYEQFLVDSCAESIELTYRYAGRLICTAIADRATDALSAVYCFFDPTYAKLSPGAYSILKQVALCREWGLRYLYLGLYVAGCATMAYKTDYLPHERLIGGSWRRFESGNPRP